MARLIKCAGLGKGQEGTVRHRSIRKSKIWEQKKTRHSLFVVLSSQIQQFIYTREQTGEAFTSTDSEKCKSEANLMPYLSSRTGEGLETLTSYTNENSQDS